MSMGWCGVNMAATGDVTNTQPGSPATLAGLCGAALLLAVTVAALHCFL